MKEVTNTAVDMNNNNDNQPIKYFHSHHVTLPGASALPMKLILNRKTRRIVRKSKVDIVRSEKQILRNERERSRKARLNTAFSVLRRALFSSAKYSDNNIEENTAESLAMHNHLDGKYTQLEVLKIASTYISQLTNQLNQSLPDERFINWSTLNDRREE